MTQRPLLYGLIGIAVLIAAVAAGYAVYRGFGSGGQRPDTVAASPDVSDEGNRRVDRIANTIAHQTRLSEEDALYLEESIAASDEIYVKRWAMAAMAEHLHKGTEMSEETRRKLEDAIVQRLSDTNHRLVINAIACVEQAGLAARPDVRERILALRDDGNPQIAARASRSPLPGDDG